MRRFCQLGPLAFVALALTACPAPEPVAGTDAGPRTDTPPGIDAPLPIDAPSATDVPGTDVPGTDAPGTDAPGLDVGVAVDAPIGPPACVAPQAGCTTVTNMTGMASVVVNHGVGNSFSPNCLRVTVGTMVSLPGAGIHPLAQGCGTEDVGVSPTGSSTAQTVTFDTVGLYGFHCMFHGTPDGMFMAMAVDVVP